MCHSCSLCSCLFFHRGNEAEIQNFDDMTVLSLENDSYVEEDILFLEDDVVSTAE